MPVQVPFDSELGSAWIVTSTPVGGTRPELGRTESHGLSTVAMNDVVPPGRPGMRTWNVTGVVLPFGTLRLMFGSLGFGSGMTTTLTGVE